MVAHQSATCQHCGQEIETLNRPDAVWVDTDGFPNCQKDLRHAPMPDGMSGAARETPAPEPLGPDFTNPDLWDRDEFAGGNRHDRDGLDVRR